MKRNYSIFDRCIAHEKLIAVLHRLNDAEYALKDAEMEIASWNRDSDDAKHVVSMLDTAVSIERRVSDALTDRIANKPWSLCEESLQHKAIFSAKTDSREFLREARRLCDRYIREGGAE